MENEPNATITETGRGYDAGNPRRNTPYSEFYIRQWHKSDNLEQLQQLVRIVFDGDLINKTARDFLHEQGLITRACGFNVINGYGIQLLDKLGVIKP